MSVAENSNPVSDVESDDVMSNAPSSDSGQSETTGIRAFRSVSPQNLPPPPVPSTCTMCDVAVAAYMCQQCGRLSFCLKCAVSLHDNKFLGSHKLTPLDDPSKGAIITVGELKTLHMRQNMPLKSHPPPVPSADIDVAPDHVDRSYPDETVDAPEDGAVLDHVAIASDRRLLRARVAEVGRCGDLLNKIASKAAHEKTHSAEATRTATDAVRRRFDLVRQLLAAKEKEFIEVIETAGKRRLDEATRTATAVSVTVTETESYVKHMMTQLDRLEGNPKGFNDVRRTMLDDVGDRTRQIDQQVADFERALDDVQRISLGVPVHLNLVIEAVQELEPPAMPVAGLVQAPDPIIPADKFLSEVGVQQWKSDGTLVSRGTPAESAVLAGAPTPRKSLAQHVEDLRNTPVPTHATSSAGGAVAAAEHAAAPSGGAATPRFNSPARTGAAAADSAPTGPHNATTSVAARSIARTAARYQSPSTGGGTSGRVFPAELDTLKKHIAQRAARRSGSTGGALVDAPPPNTRGAPSGTPAAPSTRIGRTPSRTTGTNSPARQPRSVRPGPGTPSARAMSPTAAMRARMSSNVDTPASQPGPGSYFASTNSGRSAVATPPRRGLSPLRR